MSSPGEVVDVPRVRVSGHSVAGEVYPDLVDGRVENDNGGAIGHQEMMVKSRAVRRSHSLLPENAAMVRRARINMSRRKRGFTSVVLGEVQGDTHDLAAAFGHDSPQPPTPTKITSMAQRRASVHKLLTVTKSDPLGSQGKPCGSCTGHPEYCLTALGLHDACPAHSNLLKAAPTPRRAHSLRAHAYKMTSNLSPKSPRGSFKVKSSMKSDKISEEGESVSPTGGAVQKNVKASLPETTGNVSPQPSSSTPSPTSSPSKRSKGQASSEARYASSKETETTPKKKKKQLAKDGVKKTEEEALERAAANLIVGDKEDEEKMQKIMECLRRVSI